MMDVLWKESNIFYNILCFLITENEKLFDRNDARLYWRTVLHIFTIIHHFGVVQYAQSLEFQLKYSDDINLKSLYIFRMGYLTGWNFVFQTLFLFLALTHDALEWMDKQHSALGSKLRYWRDVLYCGLVVPYTCFVFSMFWSLYAIDRELVFPKVYDDVIPWWFNQCVHTNILVMIVVETFLQARRTPTNARLELILIGVVGVLYAVVYYSIYFFAHRWLYNVFGVMTWWQVCLFQLGIWGSSFVFYFLHFPINRLIHGSEPEMEKSVDVKENGVIREIREVEEVEKVNAGLPIEKSWSLIYRNSRNGIENSNL